MKLLSDLSDKKLGFIGGVLYMPLFILGQWRWHLSNTEQREVLLVFGITYMLVVMFGNLAMKDYRNYKERKERRSTQK